MIVLNRALKIGLWPSISTKDLFALYITAFRLVVTFVVVQSLIFAAASTKQIYLAHLNTLEATFLLLDARRRKGTLWVVSRFALVLTLFGVSNFCGNLLWLSYDDAVGYKVTGSLSSKLSEGDSWSAASLLKSNTSLAVSRAKAVNVNTLHKMNLTMFRQAILNEPIIMKSGDVQLVLRGANSRLTFVIRAWSSKVVLLYVSDMKPDPAEDLSLQSTEVGNQSSSRYGVAVGPSSGTDVFFAGLTGQMPEIVASVEHFHCNETLGPTKCYELAVAARAADTNCAVIANKLASCCEIVSTICAWGTNSAAASYEAGSGGMSSSLVMAFHPARFPTARVTAPGLPYILSGGDLISKGLPAVTTRVGVMDMYASHDASALDAFANATSSKIAAREQLCGVLALAAGAAVELKYEASEFRAVINLAAVWAMAIAVVLSCLLWILNQLIVPAQFRKPLVLGVAASLSGQTCTKAEFAPFEELQWEVDSVDKHIGVAVNAFNPLGLRNRPKPFEAYKGNGKDDLIAR